MPVFEYEPYNQQDMIMEAHAAVDAQPFALACLQCDATLNFPMTENCAYLWEERYLYPAILVRCREQGLAHMTCIPQFAAARYPGMYLPPIVYTSLRELFLPGKRYFEILPPKRWETLVRHFFPGGACRFSPKHGCIVPETYYSASPLDDHQRYKILERDNFQCQLCGTAASDGQHVRLEVDHKIPRSKGGTNAAYNLWTLCKTCNRGKGTHER